MELPYNDIPIHNRVFRNGEKVRTINSVLNKIPGLYAAASNITTGGPIEQYVNAVGIPSIAHEKIKDFDLITPYGCFPVVLANFSVGLVWYHNMLLGSRMQGPFGSTEACNVAGTLIAPVLTWDTKITTFAALVGGCSDISASGLKRDGKYDRFYSIVEKEWGLIFPELRREDREFGLPVAPVPSTVPDFTQCSA